MRRRNLSIALHRIAEEVLVLEDRERRASKALSQTRGDSLLTAYQEGEKDLAEWVIKLIDMDYSLHQVADELESVVVTKEAVEVCATPSKDAPGDFTEDTDDEDE